jgi:hypothetical protein
MAHVRKGMLIASPEWWKHLRFTKRQFWKAHRLAERRNIENEKRNDDAARGEASKEK